MMGGFLITLVCIFFLYFFIKAVRETRDLHVETHHLHEDVRVMEESMLDILCVDGSLCAQPGPF